MSPRPKKHQQQLNLSVTIRETSWKLIAENGAAALSLRAIARELGITAPAIYNYFADRDALVTALIAEAFTSLGDSQSAILKRLPPDAHATRLATLGIAYREWAVAYPQRYQLIFGTPIPGYDADENVTLPAATWALSALIETLQAAFLAGRLRVDRSAPMQSGLTSMFSAWSEFAGGPDVEVLYAALIIWSRVHGLVMMEIAGQMPSFISDPGVLYRREIENIKIQYLVE
jgi:AcrR family transcriptional regulator